jgi:hypothetical protein
MSLAPQSVAGSEKLTALFGYWPSFHDAEVVEIRLRRGDAQAPFPTLAARVHVFEMTDEIARSGAYVCRHHCIVELLFVDVVQLELDDFNHQNALMGLEIAEVSERQLERVKFEVHFDGAYGTDLRFSCRSVEVVSVEPGLPPGSVYAKT